MCRSIETSRTCFKTRKSSCCGPCAWECPKGLPLRCSTCTRLSQSSSIVISSHPTFLCTQLLITIYQGTRPVIPPKSWSLSSGNAGTTIPSKGPRSPSFCVTHRVQRDANVRQRMNNTHFVSNRWFYSFLFICKLGEAICTWPAASPAWLVVVSLRLIRSSMALAKRSCEKLFLT